MKNGMTLNIRFATVSILVFATIIGLQAGTITVTNTNDSGPDSLRQALADANDGDIITFAVTGTISIKSGELLVDKSITISGPGADNLAVASSGSRVFHVQANNTVLIFDLTITGGSACCSFPDDSGAGVYNDHAILMLGRCTISGNSAFGSGGGVFNDGSFGSASLEITDSVVAGNSAATGGGGAIRNEGSSGSATLNVRTSMLLANSAKTGNGGGIYNVATDQGTAESGVNDSTFEFNFASGVGGGIYNDGESGSATLTLSNCTLHGNTVNSSGGGVYNKGIAGNAVVQNSTISGNSAGPFGGAIYNDIAATLTIDISTFSDNSAITAGGIYNDAFTSIGNTVLNAGAVGENIVNGIGAVNSLGYNLSSDDGSGLLNGPGDQINTNPLLGPLQDNGGPTFTHELLSGSPAIDTGDPTFAPRPFYDQRGPGFFRVRNGRIDIGSFEVQFGSTPTPSPTPTPTPSATPTPSSTPTPSPTATPTVTPTPTATPRARPTPRSRPSPHPRPTL